MFATIRFDQSSLCGDAIKFFPEGVRLESGGRAFNNIVVSIVSRHRQRETHMIFNTRQRTWWFQQIKISVMISSPKTQTQLVGTMSEEGDGDTHRIGRRFALNFANNSAGPYVHNYILLQSVESAGGDSVGVAGGGWWG